MDIVARELGTRPRRPAPEELPGRTEFPFQTACGLTYDSGNYQGALAKARQLAGWDQLVAERAGARAAGRLFGIGVSTYVEICAMGPSKAMPAGGWEWGCVRIEISGKVTVITGVTPHGQGQETSFAQIVADRLGVPIEDVVVLHGDTGVAHYGRDTYGSRGTVLGGTAIVMCIDKIVAKARCSRRTCSGVTSRPRGIRRRALLGTRRRAAAHLGGTGGRSVRREEPSARARAGSRGVEFLRAGELHVSVRHAHRRGRNRSRHRRGHDREVCRGRRLRDRRSTRCSSRGRCRAASRIRSGRCSSSGPSTTRTASSDRRVHGLRDAARAGDIPDYIMGSTVTPSPVNPLGIKGVGEAGTIGATPAIANAVIDALDRSASAISICR